MTRLSWLRKLLAMLALATPLAVLLGYFLDYHNGLPTYGPSWLAGGIGLFFIITTWACYIESLIRQRFVPGIPVFGNVALSLALLMGPKPWLFALAFALDPYIWNYIYMLATGKYKERIPPKE